MTTTGAFPSRFEEKVNRRGGFADFSDPLVRVSHEDGECWIWTGSTTPTGYGLYLFNGDLIGAHVASARLVGLVITGVIDHLCRRRNCVHPGHFEDVTHRENVLRGNGPTAINAAKVVCKRGHPFSAENTMIRPNRPGRECRACVTEGQRQRRAARRTDRINGGK